MARKFELNLRYFSHDTDMAHDRNIRKLTNKFGCAGYGIFCRLLECIYNDGHFIKYSDDFVFDVLDSLNMENEESNFVVQVIEYAVDCGLFDKQLYETEKILTSHGIQERYFFAKEASIRYSLDKRNTPEYPYLLVDLKELFGKQNELSGNNNDCLQNNPTNKIIINNKTKNNDDDKPSSQIEKTKKTKPKKEKPELTEQEVDFNSRLKERFPRIARMDKPLTLDGFNELSAKYGSDLVVYVMENLNNYKKITNYVDAKHTLSNWCKSEFERYGFNRQNIKHGNQPSSEPTADLAGQLAALSRNRRQQGGEMPDGM